MRPIDEIKLIDIVYGTSTNAEAYPFFLEIERAIKAGRIVRVSFHDCTPLSSSFLNSSIGSIIDEYGIDVFKSAIMLTNIKRSELDRIIGYVRHFEAA